MVGLGWGGGGARGGARLGGGGGGGARGGARLGGGARGGARLVGRGGGLGMGPRLGFIEPIKQFQIKDLVYGFFSLEIG